MARIVTKIGNVFAVKLDDSTVKYFQYVANDLTQLNSSVIRAFKKKYGLDSKIDLPEVVKGEVYFYAHCVLKWGIQLGYWEKVGKVAYVGKVEVFFRDTNDYGRKLGEDPVLISEKWFVWKINEKHQSIGRLTGEYQPGRLKKSKRPPQKISAGVVGASSSVAGKRVDRLSTLLQLWQQRDSIMLSNGGASCPSY